MEPIKIDNKFIGKNHPVYIVAEAGCNHDGSLEQGFRLIEKASESGADAIKFQTFKAHKLVTKDSPQWWLPEEQRQGKKQIDLYKNQDMFGFEEYKKLADHCKKCGITFLSTPFDEDSADLLDEIGVPAFKIASTDLTNLPFLEYIAKKNKPIILSVGMGSLEEIRESVDVIHDVGNNQIVLLHCIVEYPTPMNHANLNFIKTMQKEFPDCYIGFSDHTLGVVAPIVSASCGARLIEKHFTIDKTIRGAPDHIISVDPKELSMLVHDVRAAEDSLGSGVRTLLEHEISAHKYGRRKVVANFDIKKGTVLERDMLICKRSTEGLDPKYLKDIIGKKTLVDMKEDHPIVFSDIEGFEKKKKIIATVEARMSSSRLPGKILLEVKGRPLLDIFVERVRCSKLIDEVVVATTTNKKDDVIVELCKSKGIKYFRGSEEDVLGRVLNAAKSHNADIIVELISDNPLIDPSVVDEIIQYYLNNNYDYVSNFIPKVTFPTGMGAQVFSVKVLEEVDKLTKEPIDRENVTWYIYHHTERYKIGTVYAKGILDNPKIRLDLDYPEDFEFIKKIYENFEGFTFSLKEVIGYLQENPELMEINRKHLTGDEKYK